MKMEKKPFRLKQVSVRLKAERPLWSETPIKTPMDAARVLRNLIVDFDREAVCIINLRNDLCPINFSICSIGTLNMSLAEPRELIKAMCLSNATQVMMIHNHPSGSLDPSRQDVEITDRMCRLGSLLHIPLCDHIIVASGTDDYYSFQEHRRLRFAEPEMKTKAEDIEIPIPMAAEEPEQVREPEEAFEAEEPETVFVLS